MSTKICPVCGRSIKENEQYHICSVCKRNYHLTHGCPEHPTADMEVINPSGVHSPPRLIRRIPPPTRPPREEDPLPVVRHESRPGRPVSLAPRKGWINWVIGISAVACFVCLVIYALSSSGNKGNPSNGLRIDASSTPSWDALPSKPTALPIPTRPPSNTTLSDPSLCTEISTINVEDTSKGDVLTIYCPGEIAYKLDPLAKGEHVIAPNGSFVVYVTIDGYVYVATAGNKYLRNIGQFTEFDIFEISGAPKLEVSIYGNDPYYVKVYEENGNESRNFPIPEDISN